MHGPEHAEGDALLCLLDTAIEKGATGLSDTIAPSQHDAKTRTGLLLGMHVNAYFRGGGATNRRRDNILADGECMPSTHTAPKCERRRNAHFLKDLIGTHNLVVKNDNQTTKPSEGIHRLNAR